MPAHTPQDLYQLLIDAFNSRDIGATLALYTEDAVMRLAPGQVARGHVAIGEALETMFALKGTMELQFKGAVESPASAVTYGSFKVSGTGADGKPVVLSGNFTDVLAKQPDGTWLLEIDDPQGSAGNG